ncbi:MAG: sensor domain-containing diguanylate cyclase [Nitriliruptoraceae bacterium]
MDTAAVNPPTDGRRWSAALLVVGLPLAIVAANLSEVPGLRLRFLLVSAGIVAVIVGMRVNRPANTRPWILLVSGMSASAMGDLVVLAVSGTGSVAGNVPLDAWLTSVGGVLLLAGMFDATRAVRGSELGTTLDAIVLALAAGTMLWHFGVVRQATPGWTGSGTEVAGSLQVLFLVGIFGLLARTIWVLPLRQRTSAVLLTLGLIGALGAFLTGAVREAVGDVTAHYAGLRAGLGAAANLAAGAAALHPSMRSLTQGQRTSPDRFSVGRTVGLGVGLLVPPAIMVWSMAVDTAASAVTLVAAWALLVPTVLARLHLLARSRDVAQLEAGAIEQRMSSLMEHAGDALLLLHQTGDDNEREWIITYASKASASQLGRHPESLVDQVAASIFIDEDRPAFSELVAEASMFDRDQLPRTNDLRVHRNAKRAISSMRDAGSNDAGVAWVEVVVDAVDLDREGALVVAIRDVDERKRGELAWVEQARTDPLTGLLNRRGIDEYIEEALADVTNDSSVLGVVVSDLDGFKEINDAYGHAAGDIVLEVVAQRLRNAVRESDVVGRLGGDEFIVVCSKVWSVEELDQLARRLPEIVSKPIVVDGADPHVGISIGVALARPGVDSASRIIRRADVALYRAKSEGSGLVRWAEGLSET